MADQFILDLIGKLNKDNLTKEEKKIELDNLIDYLDTNI